MSGSRRHRPNHQSPVNTFRLLDPLSRVSPRKWAGAAGVTIALLWIILRHSLPAALAPAAPELALALRDNYPDATFAIHEKPVYALIDSLNAKKKSEDKSTGETVNPDKQKPSKEKDRQAAVQTLRQIEPSLVSALKLEPFNAGGFRLLGEMAIAQNNSSRAERLMRTATDLSVHESRALYWLMNNSLAKEKYKDAIYYADALLLTLPGAMTYVGPALYRIGEIERGRDILINRLATRPAWREQFFRSIGPGVFSNPTTPLFILLKLQEKTGDVSQQEVQAYLNYLVSLKLYKFAYMSWLQFLPESKLNDVGFINNGGFEKFSSGGFFDWSIGNGEAVNVSMSQRPDKKSKYALLANFSNARVVFPAVQQMIVLDPGDYIFSGEFSGNLVSRRGLVWSVSCVTGQQIAQSGLLDGATAGWKSFSFTVRIPKEKCEAQYISLAHAARTPSEQFASGHMWFDNLKAERAPEVKEPPPLTAQGNQ
jgi:hypothetical protein